MAKIDEQAFYGMRLDQTYVSRSFRWDSEGRPMRYVSKVVEPEIADSCEIETNELIIRQKPGSRQQIKVLFYEDNRQVESLTFQRFREDGANPSKREHFSFKGEEIERILWVLEVAKRAEFDSNDKVRFADAFIREVLQEDADLVKFLQQNRERISQIEDIGNLAQYLELCERKRQLAVFERLLGEPDYFQEVKVEWEKHKPEDVWQHFFERNPWIFGLNLAPVFLSSLKGKKLEQVVRGSNVAQQGKRVDALMHTNGILGSLCFVEIKTSRTPLLVSSDYRPGTWGVSDEVAGAIAQCHVTVQGAMEDLRNKLNPKDKLGNPTGEEYFLYQPRSYLVVGSLNQFKVEHGVNEAQFRSFELFRRSLRVPEIITFDELLERARAVVASSPRSENAANAR